MRPVHVQVGLDGGATQDAVEWWAGLVAASREAIAGAGADPDGLHAIAITGQWGSSVPVAPTAGPSARFSSGRTRAPATSCARSSADH